MIINALTGSGKQRVRFSDGTYLDFQIIEREVVVNSTDNKYIAEVYNGGKAFFVDLNGSGAKLWLRATSFKSLVVLGDYADNNVVNSDTTEKPVSVGSRRLFLYNSWTTSTPYSVRAAVCML